MKLFSSNLAKSSIKKAYSLFALVFCLILTWHVPTAISLSKKSRHSGCLTLRLGPGELGSRFLAVPQGSLLRVELPATGFVDGRSWSINLPPKNESLSFLSHGVVHKDDISADQNTVSEVSFFEFECDKIGKSLISWRYGSWSQIDNDSFIQVEVMPDS